MFNGLLDLSWWQKVLALMVLTHITIAAVTIFLHRAQAHRAVELGPFVSHFFRLWLWLTTGMVTREWVAIHRKHHAKCETGEDPHSPQVLGLSAVLWRGAELYQVAAKDTGLLQRYGKGTPDDWLERHIYARHPNVGVTTMLALDLLLFGVAGLAIWALQMIWIPFWAAGVINGVGHFWGYRNFLSPDASTNIIPVGLLIGGEELHNNHHAFPSSARLSSKWWEFDIGWVYIRMLASVRLLRVKKLAPRPRFRKDKNVIDLDTLKAVLLSRMHLAARYAQEVIRPVTKSELCRSEVGCRKAYRQAKKLLMREQRWLDPETVQRLQALLKESQALATVYQYRARLQAIWERTQTSQESLLKSLQEWCRQAELTGIESLESFARSLRGYSLQAGV